MTLPKSKWSGIGSGFRRDRSANLLSLAVARWFRAQVKNELADNTWPAIFSVVIAALIQQELIRNRGNISHAARSMGVSRETLRKYIKKYL